MQNALWDSVFWHMNQYEYKVEDYKTSVASKINGRQIIQKS